MMSRSVAFQRTRKLLFQNRARLVWSDRKSTRLNSSHSQISYAVFCLKKKTTVDRTRRSNVYLINHPQLHRHLCIPPVPRLSLLLSYLSVRPMRNEYFDLGSPSRQ